MANEEKKFSKILLKDKTSGKTYELAFTKNTIRQMERRGFRLDTDAPATMVTELFRGAFLKNRYRLDNKQLDDLWAAQSKKDDLLNALIKLYSDVMDELLADSGEEDDEENPTWETA